MLRAVPTGQTKLVSHRPEALVNDREAGGEIVGADLMYCGTRYVIILERFQAVGFAILKKNIVRSIA